MNPKVRERLSQARGIYRFRREGPRLLRSDPSGQSELVSHANAIDGFRGMAGKPTEHVCAQPGLGQNIPDRFAPAAGTRDRADPTHGIRFGEAMDAVFIRALARGDRVPKHG